jgi:hypothetical protein
VKLTDKLDADTTFVSATGGGVYDSNTHTVTWNIGTLAVGADGSVKLVVQVKTSTQKGTVLTNTCTIDSDETEPTTEEEKTVVDGICHGSVLIFGCFMEGWLPNIVARVSCNQGTIAKNSFLIYADYQIPIKAKSTSIDSFNLTNNVVTIGGSCTVNHTPDYTFQFTAKNSNPYTFEISITGPDNFTYSKSGAFRGILEIKGGKPPPESQTALLPRKNQLEQNYPNPFNPDTWIPYQLAQPADVTLRIFDVKGQLVRSIHLGYKQAGFYIGKNKAAYWDGRNDQGEQVAAGIYLYSLRAGNFQATRKMIIIK